MTPLLSFVEVTKRYPDGDRELVVLDRACLDIDAGASVGVYGPRKSGKSTLLRMAAGLEQPDSGAVRYDGRDMARMSASERARLLRKEIAFIATGDWRTNPGENVVDHVATSLGSERLTMKEARRRARRILEEVGVRARDVEEMTADLSLADSMKVMLARALARNPRLLVFDESAQMPGLRDREQFFALLRTAARERGTALLIASEEISVVTGLGVMMSISDGELGSSESSGIVVPLPTRPRPAPDGSRKSSQR